MLPVTLVSLLLASLSSLPAALAADWPFALNDGHAFREIIVFGDSFSDDASHGAWKLSNGTWPADPAYWEGRFSNGPVWIEQAAHTLQIPLRDYAVGGATSDNDLVQGRTGPNMSIPVPALVDQVAYYMSREHGSNMPHHSLFVILIGANDAFFRPEVLASQIAGKIELVVQRLKDIGAYSFLLVSPPSLTTMPFIYQANLDAESIANYALLSTNLHYELRKLRLRLQSTEYKLKVGFLDLTNLFKSVLASPERFGFDATLIRQPCLKGVYYPVPEGRTLCSDPNRHLFWDEFHPTEAGHSLAAHDAVHVIKRRFGSLAGQ